MLQLLGPWEAWVRGRPMRPLRTRKGQWLLALLLLRRGGVERDWLAGLLWPHSADSEALSNLRRSLTDLRRALGPEASRLQAPTSRTLSFDPTGAQVDLLRFDAAMAQGDPPALRVATELYRGPLLAGCHEAWIIPERLAREQAYLAALSALAGEAQARGDLASEVRYLRASLAVDPLQ